MSILGNASGEMGAFHRMARSLSLIAAAALLAAPVAASVQNSGVPPVSPAAAAAGALVCRGLPDDEEAAAERLVALGWNRKPMPNATGGPPLAYFERDNLLLSFLPSQAGTGCMVVAPLAPWVRWADLVAAATAAFGRAPEGAGASEGNASWRLDGRYLVMLIHRSGTARATFTVMPIGNTQ
jgi:hypothetical protein